MTTVVITIGLMILIIKENNYINIMIDRTKTEEMEKIREVANNYIEQNYPEAPNGVDDSEYSIKRNFWINNKYIEEILNEII